jgi:hypothetical protein
VWYEVLSMKCFMHEKLGITHIMYGSIHYVLYPCEKVTSCLPVGMAAHKFNINIIAYNTALPNLGYIENGL